MAGRTRMTAPQRREQILDVTRSIVVVEGFRAATVDRIARAAGVTRAVIYQHFVSLPGVFNALVDRETARVLASLTDVVNQPARPGIEPGLAALAAFLDATDADPDSWRMLLSPPEGGPPELYERIAAGRALGRARILELLGANDPGERFGHPDRELTAHLLQTVTDEMLRLHIQDPERYPARRLLAETTWLLDALTAAQNRRSSSTATR